jgi:hypothetical protein
MMGLSSCNETEPCVSGFEVGHTYKVTVLRRYDEGRSLVSLSYQDGTCEGLGDVNVGAQFAIRLEDLAGPGVGCRSYAARIVGPQPFEVERDLVSTSFRYLGPPVIVASVKAQVRQPGGCRGWTRLELGVPDSKDPFALQPNNAQRRVVLVRGFELEPEDALCRGQVPTLQTSPSMRCLDVFEVNISR